MQGRANATFALSLFFCFFLFPVPFLALCPSYVKEEAIITLNCMCNWSGSMSRVGSWHVVNFKKRLLPFERRGDTLFVARGKCN